LHTSVNLFRSAFFQKRFGHAEKDITSSLFAGALVHVSLNFVFLAERAPILPDHAHFLATETWILDRHAEE
jgi:hypothetical protein